MFIMLNDINNQTKILNMNLNFKYNSMNSLEFKNTMNKKKN